MNKIRLNEVTDVDVLVMYLGGDPSDIAGRLTVGNLYRVTHYGLTDGLVPVAAMEVVEDGVERTWLISPKSVRCFEVISHNPDC